MTPQPWWLALSLLAGCAQPTTPATVGDTLPTDEVAALRELLDGAKLTPAELGIRLPGRDKPKGFDRVAVVRERHVVRLELRDTALTTLAPLAALPRLEGLTASGPSLGDSLPCEQLTALTRLSLSDAPLPDLSSLGRCQALQGLEFAHNGAEALPPLPALPALESFGTYGNPITSLAFLGEQPALRYLMVVGARLTDLTSLRDQPKLELLRVLDSGVPGCPGAERFSSVETLDCDAAPAPTAVASTPPATPPPTPAGQPADLVQHSPNDPPGAFGSLGVVNGVRLDYPEPPGPWVRELPDYRNHRGFTRGLTIKTVTSEVNTLGAGRLSLSGSVDIDRLDEPTFITLATASESANVDPFELRVSLREGTLRVYSPYGTVFRVFDVKPGATTTLPGGLITYPWYIDGLKRRRGIVVDAPEGPIRGARIEIVEK